MRRLRRPSTGQSIVAHVLAKVIVSFVTRAVAPGLCSGMLACVIVASLRNDGMKKRLQFLLGAIFFAFLLVYGANRFYRSLGILDMESDPGFTVRITGTQARVGQIRNAELAEILRWGDEVLAINGQPIKHVSDVVDMFQHISPRTPYTLNIRRGPASFDLTILSQAIPLTAWILNGFVSLILPNIFLLTGLIVFMLRPDNKQALLLALMFGMFTGALSAFDPSYGGESTLAIGITFAVHAASLFLWPVFFHFFQIFPEPSPLVKRVPRLEAYLYLPQLLTIFPYFLLLNIVAAFSPNDELAFRIPALVPIICIIVAIAYISGGLASLLINYRQSRRASRRKLRVVVAGSIAGFLPIFLIVGLAILFDLPRSNPKLTRLLSIA